MSRTRRARAARSRSRRCAPPRPTAARCCWPRWSPRCSRNSCSGIRATTQDKANFGSPSPGSLPHFFGIMLGRAIGVDMVHVAYKGGAPMLNDLMGGQISAGLDTHIELIELHKSGKIRILASFGEKRSALCLTSRRWSSWARGRHGQRLVAAWAPAKTPPAAVAALNKALNIALANADAREKLLRSGTEPATSTPEELEKFRLAEIEKWRPVIAASGFKAD
ncbi:MAG: hypothetical protein IPI73_26695 [Betaproteobacteria bacterium]|nr:hypothetical protein [Betaproteobacteria bacterium]